MRIVSHEEMQAIDHFASSHMGLKTELLMENAGRAVFEKLAPRIKKTGGKTAVIAGKGNNGGDGYAAARYLMQSGYEAEVLSVVKEEKLSETAALHRKIYTAAGGKVTDVSLPHLEGYQVIIDAMLGTGIKGEPREPYSEWIEAINKSEAEIFAIDIPSGVPASGENFSHNAVKARRTVTLHYPKLSAFTFPGSAYYGELDQADIGIPPQADGVLESTRKVWQAEDLKKTFPERSADAHKSDFGRGLIIAGSEDMPGAAIMSTRAAVRSGAGLMTVASEKSVTRLIAPVIPEVMLTSADLDEDELENFDAVAYGPGAGRDRRQEALLEKLLGMRETTLILDADGLYFLNHHLESLKKRKAATILTPHPGEMARILDTSVKEVQNDRFGAARDFAKAHQVYLLLKGPFTIVTCPDGSQYVNPTGNPALAKGGSGDVLTGIITAMFMQHEQTQAALSNAAYLHGQAACDLTSQGGLAVPGVTATDLISQLPQTLKRLLS